MTDSAELLVYRALDPDTVLNAVETTGIQCNGRLFALNSYENRVYQLGIDDAPAVIAKFYRPQRWSDEAILEEHAFSHELARAEIPVVAPMEIAGKTLHQYQSFRFCLYPSVGGRAPELDNKEHLAQLGRLIGRIHAQGRTGRFQFRSTLSPHQLGDAAVNYLLESNYLPAELEPAYASTAGHLLEAVHHEFDKHTDLGALRLHGDCHAGNILWRDDVASVVDFDDSRTGPAIQDLWMFLSGDRKFMTARLSDLLDGYREFSDFNAREIYLIEPLRSLRILHYAAWLAKRFEEPAFQTAFPWFNDARYWDQHILTLREQLATLQEPPLQLD